MIHIHMAGLIDCKTREKMGKDRKLPLQEKCQKADTLMERWVGKSFWCQLYLFIYICGKVGGGCMVLMFG